MKRKIVLGVLLVLPCNLAASDAATHVVRALVVCAALMARPVTKLVKRAAGYGPQSVVGVRSQEKAGKKEFKLNVGAVDFKVKAPVVLSDVVKKRSEVATEPGFVEQIMSYVDSFLPYVEIAVADKYSPLIIDREVVEDALEKRFYITFSLGEWSARIACSMQEIAMLATATVGFFGVSQVQSALTSTDTTASTCPFRN